MDINYSLKLEHSKLHCYPDFLLLPTLLWTFLKQWIFATGIFTNAAANLQESKALAQALAAHKAPGLHMH